MSREIDPCSLWAEPSRRVPGPCHSSEAGIYRGQDTMGLAWLQFTARPRAAGLWGQLSCGHSWTVGMGGPPSPPVPASPGQSLWLILSLRAGGHRNI